MDRRYRRRVVLGTILFGATAGVAGCSSGDGSDDETDDGNGDGGREEDSGIDGGNSEPPTGVVGQFRVDAANTGLVPDGPTHATPTLDWRYPEESADAVAGLTYGDGRLYTVVRTGNSQRLVALDPASGEVLNEQTVSGSLMPVYRDGTLYVADRTPDGRLLRALSPADFSEDWSSSCPLETAEMTATDDAVYGFALAGGENVVRSVSAADGSLRWERPVALSGFASARPPAVGEENVFVSGDSLNALARTDGSEQWSATAESAFTSPPLVAEGAVYAGTDNGRIKGYDTADGTELLDVEGPSSFGIEGPLAYADGRLFGRWSFSVFAVDVDSETVAWDVDRSLGSAVTVSGDHLLGLRTSGQRVVGLNRSDGSIAWKAGPDTGARALAGGGRVFALGNYVFAGYNGQVLALSCGCQL